MDPEEDLNSISCLPDEIIVMILRYNNNYRDIVHFSMTCKHFYETVKTNNLLWKNIYKQTIPEMLETIQLYGSGDWYKEVKEYYGGKKGIFAGLIEMASIYYERVNAILFSDISRFYNGYALSRPQNYYYTVNILHKMIRTTERVLTPYTNKVNRPYTLTEMYYARTSLRCYFHAFLALKWSIWSAQRVKPTPLQVVTFFVQWVWNENLESQEVADRKIEELVEKVQNLLEHSKGFQQFSIREFERQRLAGAAREQQILSAITHVLYTQRHVISATNTANYDTLDVSKVLENRCGHHIAILAIYQSIALRFGLVCELNVIPNHLFLEWSPDWDDPDSASYIVDITTGALKPKGRCPFARAGPPARFRYSPDSLLESLYMAFHRTMGYIQNWHTINAGCLTELLKMDDEDDNAYRKFLPMLHASHRTSNLAAEIPLDLKYISTIHRDLLASLFKLDAFIPPLFREPVYQRHPSQIKYAVGMICSHTRSGYKCVIKGWDVSACPPGSLQQLRLLRSESGMEALQLMGEAHPFYLVLAADQSTRHVPQDFLVNAKQPVRLAHLEENLAKEFSHFDGFRYVPNASKQREYPDDNAIALMYKSNSRAPL